MTSSFCVAGHTFNVSIPDGSPLVSKMAQYSPFLSTDCPSPLFSLEMTERFEMKMDKCIYAQEPEEGEARIEIWESEQQYYVRFSVEKNLPFCCYLRSSKDWSHAQFCCAPKEDLFSLNNSLMLLYAFSTAGLSTLEMHASVIANDGKAYLFLARSGTGKSTHSSLWMQWVPGSELLNDDNPIVRTYPDGRVIAYGSPWSGKTPCYKNMEAEVGAFVLIKRAPYNKCTPLSTLEGYASIYSSSSGLKIDPDMADSLHETIASVLGGARCFVMECLPDKEAAIVCSQTVRA